jgi:hypothetical protein
VLTSERRLSALDKRHDDTGRVSRWCASGFEDFDLEHDGLAKDDVASRVYEMSASFE